MALRQREIVLSSMPAHTWPSLARAYPLLLVPFLVAPLHAQDGNSETTSQTEDSLNVVGEVAPIRRSGRIRRPPGWFRSGDYVTK